MSKVFYYVNDIGFITSGQNHSMHIWESAYLAKEEIGNITENVPFITSGDFETSIFDKEYNIVCYSLLPDCHAGLYKNKESEAYISFGSCNFDLTDKNNTRGYIDGSIVNHAFPFTEEIINRFSLLLLHISMLEQIWNEKIMMSAHQSMTRMEMKWRSQATMNTGIM